MVFAPQPLKGAMFKSPLGDLGALDADPLWVVLNWPGVCQQVFLRLQVPDIIVSGNYFMQS